MTIKDIAKALNCSTSTVSRALRGSYEISDETKRTILEYAEKINYRPTRLLSPKNRKTRSIAVMMTEVANNFFQLPSMDRIYSLQQGLSCNHYAEP